MFLTDRPRVELHRPSETRQRLIPLAQPALHQPARPGDVAVAGVARVGHPELPQRRLVVQLAPVVDLPQREVRLGELGVAARSAESTAARAAGEPGLGPLGEVELPDVRAGEAGEGEREARVQLGRLDVHPLRRADRVGDAGRSRRSLPRR